MKRIDRVPSRGATDHLIEFSDRSLIAKSEDTIDEKRRSVDPGLVRDHASEENAGSRRAIAERQVQSFEAAAPIHASRAVEVPPAAFALQRVAVRERILVAGPR